MANPTINVVRYTALVGGIAYGIWHRRTLQARFEASAAANELKKRQRWIEQAKSAWKEELQKKNGQALGAEGALVTDPDAPGFDLEALLKSWEK